MAGVQITLASRLRPRNYRGMPPNPDQVDWRRTLRTAVELAAEDPERFRAEMKAVGQRLGMTAEQVYAKLQQDPEIGKHLARESVNRVIQKGARRLKEELRKAGIGGQ